MKNKKEFIGITLSVLVCVFLIGLATYATTTISNNIITEGSVTIGTAAITSYTLGVDGTASISDDFYVTGDDVLFQPHTDQLDAFIIASSAYTIGDDYVAFVVDTINNRVGIGTTAPQSPLEVYGNVTLGGGATTDFGTEIWYNNSYTDVTQPNSSILRICNFNTTDNTVSGIGFSSTFTGLGGASVEGVPSAGIGAQFLVHNDPTGFVWPTDLYFWTGNGLLTGGAERMRIKADGEVGIGTTLPTTELSIVGTASISQDLWASGSFQFGGGEGIATLSYSRLGSATTGHSLADADDLLVTGKSEFNDTSFFDGLVSVSDTNGLQIGGGATIKGGTASPSGSCTVGDIFIDSSASSGTGADRIISVCDVTNEWSAIDVQ